jgi:hypothetical protein
VATRFYFPATASNTSGLTPSFDAGWNYQAEAARCDLKSTKGSSAISAGTQVGAWTATAGQTALDRQFISGPLAAQTISGTFSLMLMVREFAGTDNVDRIITGLYVVNSSGTKVHTLKAIGNSGTTLEFVANATHRTHTGANAVAITSYACASGDRIVAEIGYSNSTSATTPEASAKWGENATDATINDNATTADRAGWIEFSANLTFASTPVTGTLAGTSTSAGSLLGKLGKLVSAAGASVSAGTLVVLRGLLALLTAIAGSVGTLGALVGRTGLLPGTSSGTATLTGTIEEDSASAVTGTLSGASVASGTLAGIVGRIGTVAGDATSQGTLAAATATPVAIAGAASSSGTLSATIEEASDETPCAQKAKTMGLGLCFGM